MKDWLYQKVVRRNERIQREYERYVLGHIKEHQSRRLRHWLVLLGLSWKYRNSQKNKVHALVLIKQKGTIAKMRMEWIPGAVCYNVYRSRDGIHYHFLDKVKKHVYTARELEPESLYFYKFKVSLDGTHYSGFSEVLTVSTVHNQELFLMQKLAQSSEISKTEKGGVKKENQPAKTSKSDHGVSETGRLPSGAESGATGRPSAMHFAKGLMPYEVISFDIFDTLLFRPFSKPSDLFILVGEQLDIMDFCEIRIQAEQKAREESFVKRGNKEVTLEEIYHYVEEETGVPAEEGMEVEFRTECRLCYANPYMMEVFRMLKGQGKILAAVSDMYLPEERMKELLKCGGYQGFDTVMVSCDYHCSKRNGGLYDVLKSRYAGKSLVHIGDNDHSDIKSARAKGIENRYYQNVNEAGSPFRAGNMSHLIGSAYRGMVNAKLHSGRWTYSPYYEVGYVYTGIYVMGFCQWIYRYVMEHQVEKILFLAREGDLYQKVFREMYPHIPTEYVLWSRVPVVKTIVEKNRHPYLLQLVHHKANALYPSKVGTLFDRIGIGALKPYLKDYRLREETYLTPDNEKMVRSLMLEHWQELCKCYKKDQAYIQAYLRQKIGTARQVAVVDVGWSGNNVLQVQYLAEQVYQMDCRVHCLLAAARNVNDTYMAGMMQRGAVQTYLFSNLYNKELHDTHQKENHRLNSFFFEILTQSSTPTFLGFDAEGHFKYDIPEVENYSRNQEIHKGTLDFVKEYKDHFKDYPYMLDISGHDAYMPFRHFSRNLDWLKTYFGDYIFGRDLFATQEKAVMESVEEVMKKAKLWEENV